ncbi:MAG: coat protein [Sanya tombus-like virus 3]|nr:MAG: coat protein [Sanya tombus-like virus 3]
MSGPLLPFMNQGRVISPWMNLAAAAGGAAAREGLNYVGGAIGNYFRGGRGARRGRGRGAYNMQPLYQAMPVPVPTAPPRRRRRGGGGRRGSRGTANQATGGGQITVVRGQENVITLNKGTAWAIQAWEFNCSAPARLAATSKAYERYRVRRVTIKYCSGSGQATPGSIAIGYHAGVKNAKVDSQDTILKLSPCRFTPAWKDVQLVIGPGIDAQRWMHVGRTDEDGISFTFYAMGSGDATGRIIVDYEVELAYPVPF